MFYYYQWIDTAGNLLFQMTLSKQYSVFWHSHCL